jgi:16S rRNA (guanine527-N7)-methyltransferase
VIPAGGDAELPAGPGDLLAQLERARSLGLLGPGPVEDHLVHAEGFIAAVAEVSGRVVDLGSGAGVPGLPIACARPDLELVLVDSSARRGAFLESVVDALGLQERVRVVVGRAEVVGRSELRGTADAVVARGFGPPAATAECSAPLLRIGGRLVVSEPPEGPPRWPAAGIGPLGLAALGPPGGTPRLQVLELRSPCPDEYPRRDGVPAKRPLF